MAVDYHLKVQVKVDNNWETISVNGHDTYYNCGRWLYSLISGSSLANNEYPEPKQDYDWGHTCFTLRELEQFYEEKKQELTHKVEESEISKTLKIVNAKLNALLTNSKYEEPEEDYDWRDDMLEYDLESVQCLEPIMAYAKFVSETYVNGYISPDDIRLLLSFDN